MKLLDYMRVIADTVSDDTLIVASHTKNIMGWLMMNKPNAYFGDLNMGLTTHTVKGAEAATALSPQDTQHRRDGAPVGSQDGRRATPRHATRSDG